MLARYGRVSAPVTCCLGFCRTSRIGTVRSYASSLGGSPAATTSAAPSHLAPLSGLAKELDAIAPRFEIDAADIQVLKEPKDFYEVLKTKILASKRRIYLATLYIGKTEHELIDTLRLALQRNPTLRVSILTDYFRGTRESPDPSCASLLAPLIADFGSDRVEIRMWHTPNLTGVREKMLPKRINEGWGLQHMKLYGFDDELVLSGANLSNDYFTNRQDRYHLFRSKALTDYYHRIYAAVCSISYSVSPSSKSSSKVPDPGYDITWPSTNTCASPQEDTKAYIKSASSLLSPLIQPSSGPPPSSKDEAVSDPSRAIVFPLFQLAPLLPAHNSTELPALTLLLRCLANPAFQPTHWTFTAGYFNMTPAIRDLLLASVDPIQHSSAAGASPLSAQPTSRGTVLTAHPEANGFYGSKGVSGMLPPAYTLLAKRFLRAVKARNLGQNISLMEWKRGTCGEPNGWTYHAKGLWVTLPKAKDPGLTLIGSSNYTARSHTLDLEANALVLTNNKDLQERLGAEEKHLREGYAKEVDMDEFSRTERRVGLKVRVALWIVGLVGGAL